VSGTRLAGRIARLVLLVGSSSLATGLAASAAAQAPERRLPASARRDTTTAEVLAPVATRRLDRGKVIGPNDFTMARVAVRATANGRLAQAGWVTRRVIKPGELLREPAVAPAPLVGAGQTVSYTFRSGGIELTLEGVAMNAGSLGSDVAVRLDPKRRVVGTVTGPGRVESRDSGS
jgi:flagella basal body P-ring formation protein FlgA